MKQEIETKFDKVWDIKQQFENRKKKLISEKAALEERQKEINSIVFCLDYGLDEEDNL